jgi:hypothetical protein
MCDYSLLALPNRLARERDHLVVHRFSTGTLGLIADVPEPFRPHPPAARSWWWRVTQWLRESDEVVPCVVCTARGAIEVAGHSRRCSRDIRIAATEDVTCTQIGAGQRSHRDAIRFANGREMLLQQLTPGQRVDVISLTLAEDLETEPMSSGRVSPRLVTLS